jgi:SPP1 family predicted phage head-tail adaptor
MAKREVIGRLDRRITFQGPVFTRNEYNEPELTGWADVLTTWAHLMPSPGGETYLADQLTVVNTTSFMIRYRTDINEKMRVLFDERVYNIVSITEPPEYRREWMQVKVELNYEAEA